MRKLYKFQTELKRTQKSLDNATKSDPFYQNEHIDFENGYGISIQCCSSMYCSPRISQLDPTLYYEYEVGVSYVGGEFDMTNFFLSIGHSHIEDTWLAAYVPSDKVQMIYDHVRKIPTPEGRLASRKKKIDKLVNN